MLFSVVILTLLCRLTEVFVSSKLYRIVSYSVSLVDTVSLVA